MGSGTAQLRLMADLKSITCEPPEGCSASPASDDNLFVWSATIFGPDETPWEGGVYSLRLIFGENYPEKPPRVRFTCDMFHPNVVWVPKVEVVKLPAQTAKMFSRPSLIRSLLTDPNPASPANPEAAQQFQNDIQAYNKRVRRCARRSIET